MIVKTRSMRWPVFAVIRFALSRDLRGIGGVLMKKWFILIACLWAFQASAQTTYPAASCSQAAVAAAITAEQAHPVDGDIVSIPSGSCTWTSTQKIDQTFANSVTIQGAGAISSTTGGVSTTGSDQTVIIDNTTASNGSLIKIHTTAGKTFRWTGISLQGNASSTQEAVGILHFDGASTAVRVDHCHFFIPSQTSQGLVIAGSITGVADHNYFNSTPNSLTNNMNIRNGLVWNGDKNGLGSGSWADSDHWGSSQFFFVEDSRFFDGDPGEFDDSGRGVWRYNTITGSSGSTESALQIFWHGLATGAGRGGRAAEFYNNTFASNGNNGNAPITLNSGTALAWGNTVTGGYRNVIQLSYNFRNLAGGGGNYNYPPPPAGWGFCGSAAGGPTNWDGNHNTTSGYPCLGQPGRGKGDFLNGTNFATLVSSTTGTVAWPHEALSPIYAWNNTYTPQFFTGTPVIGNGCSGLCTENTDFYQQFGNGGNTGTFNGTVGIGQGLLSARPSTCTAGTDPMTGGAAPGVGYWATDTNTLYVCNPTNTWTAYYTPYTYPHPLTQSSTGATVAAPANLSATVN